MTKVMHGIVRGRTIELDDDVGLEDGRQVEVIVRTKVLPGPPPGWRPDSTVSAAGMMAPFWTEDDDRIMEEIRRDRRIESRSRIVE